VLVSALAFGDLGMTLAAILLDVLFTLSPLSPAPAPLRIPIQSASTTKPADATSSQDQNNTQSPNSQAQGQPQSSQTAPPQSTPSNPPAAHKSPATHKPHNKKQVPEPSDCSSAVSGAPPGSQDSAQPAKTASDPSQAGSVPAGNEPTAKAPSAPCSLPKVVVQQGGTSEPSIQIVGGTDNAPARAASQYLQSAEDNLKKIAGRQLSSSQRDVVTQIHQFMDQSKTATAAGDLESARTLAWKAQVLSENLVNPDK